MSTVPTTNISLRELYKTMYANTATNITNVSMDTLHGTAPSVPATGAISMSSFKSKIGQSTSISTFSGWSTSATSFTATSGNSPYIANSGLAFGYMWLMIAYCGLYRSTDGSNWTLAQSGNYYNPASFNIGNGVIRYDNKITVDGTNWITTADTTIRNYATTIDKIPSTGTLVAGIFDQSTIPYTGTNGLAYSTNNGSTWTYLSSAGGINFGAGISMIVGYWPSIGKMYATGTSSASSNNNLRFTSTNGSSWTALTPGSSAGYYLGAGSGMGNSGEVKLSDGTPAFAFTNRNDASVYFTDGSTSYSAGMAIKADYTGQVNGWYIITPFNRIGSFTQGQYMQTDAFWSATGQKWQPWTVYTRYGVTQYIYSDVAHIPYNNRVYQFSFTSNSQTQNLNYGYYDFSTVTPN